MVSPASPLVDLIAKINGAGWLWTIGAARDTNLFEVAQYGHVGISRETPARLDGRRDAPGSAPAHGLDAMLVTLSGCSY
jgi:hypothetical protein